MRLVRLSNFLWCICIGNTDEKWLCGLFTYNSPLKLLFHWANEATKYWHSCIIFVLVWTLMIANLLWIVDLPIFTRNCHLSHDFRYGQWIKYYLFDLWAVNNAVFFYLCFAKIQLNFLFLFSIISRISPLKHMYGNKFHFAL